MPFAKPMTFDPILTRDPAIPAPPDSRMSTFWRPFLLALGGLSVALGVVGLFLPGLPTTPLMLVALWAFSKSSVTLRNWLWYHPTFGPSVRAWFLHQVIPRVAKIAAVVTMIIAVIILATSDAPWFVPAIVAGILIPVATWICTRRSVAPQAA
jgi:uncharacterized membrane protein YbaN (DUF454 family)